MLCVFSMRGSKALQMSGGYAALIWALCTRFCKLNQWHIWWSLLTASSSFIYLSYILRPRQIAPSKSFFLPWSQTQLLSRKNMLRSCSPSMGCSILYFAVRHACPHEAKFPETTNFHQIISWSYDYLCYKVPFLIFPWLGKTEHVRQLFSRIWMILIASNSTATSISCSRTKNMLDIALKCSLACVATVR